uniref:Uncharacterized protein n=1 Tax=Ciona savignyi TaxID=51511 RepID=H2YR31_CIOSA
MRISRINPLVGDCVFPINVKLRETCYEEYVHIQVSGLLRRGRMLWQHPVLRGRSDGLRRGSVGARFLVPLGNPPTEHHLAHRD